MGRLCQTSPGVIDRLNKSMSLALVKKKRKKRAGDKIVQVVHSYTEVSRLSKPHRSIDWCNHGMNSYRTYTKVTRVGKNRLHFKFISSPSSYSSFQFIFLKLHPKDLYFLRSINQNCKTNPLNLFALFHSVNVFLRTESSPRIKQMTDSAVKLKCWICDFYLIIL